MMAAAGTFQLSHEFGICTNHHRSRQFRSLTASGKLHLLGANISSLSLRQDSWSLRLSDRIHRPLRAIPHGCNLFKCHSFLNPSHTLHNSSIKNAALELTRSCSALQSNSIVLKLVPAVTIVLFAVWVLGPLMRLSRNIFLHKSDSSWKKSSANYVMTSYLQPLLLWTGAILICRALDPVVLPTEASEMVKQRLLNFVRSLSTVLAFAYCLSSVIQQTQKFFMETKDPADTRNMGFQFAGKAVYTAVWVAAVSLFMELLGFSTQKWLTAGGLGTVLLTLAGREIFTNFLSSAMIHATRPFVVNEWIQTKIEGYDVSGTVEHVGWWSPTIIRGEDREAVHIPNHKFTMNVVRNLTQKTHWRIKTHLAISHLDVNKINNIVADMRKVLAKNPQVEQQRLHRRVFLENVNPENQALLILVSCFVKTSHFEEYLCVKEAILLDLLRVISHHRARLATPIRTVQKIYSDDLDSMPFADSTFTRGRAAANRPLLLIEPSYKVNGEDKTKSQTRSTRINVDQDSKASRPISDNNQVDAKGGTSGTKTKEKSAPESKMRQSSSLDTKVNSKAGDVPNPDKAVEKEKHLSKSALKADPKSAKVSSDSNASPVSDNSAENKPKKKPLSETGGDNKANGVASTSSRPVLEENIVLGVALDGSKRTLPIEEEMAPSATAPEVKELATFRSGSGSPPADKDSKKDGQNSYVPGSTPADQCDHAAQI